MDMNEEFVNIAEEFSPKHAKNREKQGQNRGMVNISINIPMEYENKMQELQADKKYPSRSQIVRLALKDYLFKDYKFFKRLRK